MSEEGQRAESDVKTVAEILKSEGNDELKFGLLISLIKVNQASSKDVVNTVLHLLVGGEFEIETNFVIQDPQNILQMLTALEQCPDNLQAEIWSVFLAMLKKSRRNLQACTEVGLISKVMDLLLKAEEVVADLLVDLLGALAAYSITVKELRQLFRYLKADDGTWPRHSVKLISVLKQMPQRQGPDEFFSFPGKKGSCIHVPPVKTWPYQSGWTFSCWLRLDPVTGVTVERERPYLFCFHTNKGVGYSANFLGNSLVITSMKVKGKGFQHCVKYEFQPRKWYMVSIVHVYNRWSKSEIRCYVDGQLASGTDMSWLVSTYDPFDKCYIGGSSEGDVDHMFSGQLSALYLFSEALSPQQISSIHELGPSYKSQFRFPNESQVRLSETAHRLLYDGKLTTLIVFMYNPIACDGQLCLESSPKGNVNHFQHSPHAMMSGEVKSVITHSIHSTLHSLGGVQILFPLFGQLDLPVAQGDETPSVTDHTTCANLLGLLYNLIESSSTIHQQMVQNKGFLVIGHLLEKSSRDHVTPSVLEVFLKLTDYLVKCPSGGTLLKHLFDHILFNPAIWIHSSMEVQTKLYCYLATDFISDAQIYNNIRRVSAVLQTMHTLKYYYWVINPKDRSGITPKAVDGPRPEYDEIIKLRSFMLLYIKQLLLKGQGVQEDELQSMLNYLCTLHEDDNLVDVLELLVSLMSEHPQSMVPAFDRKQGVRTVFKLLASPNEDIRIKTLKLFGFWLSRSTPKRKQDSLAQHNLFSLLGERLLLNDQHITIATYNACFEMLTERVNLESYKAKHEEPESHFRIENSALLKVVATMIRQSKPSPEILEVKRNFLSDLTILCKNNKENRRTVLQMSVWQDWLFSMAYVYPQNQEQQKITEMVMALFRMLLHHAIKFEFGGWRVWIDTLAILHSKVAYEDFKRHMAKMYKQYDRQRVDDYAGQEERNRQPISTISGVSDTELNKPVPKSTVKVTEIEEQAEAADAEKSLDNESEAGSKTDQSEGSKTVNGEIEADISKDGVHSAAEHQRDRQKMPSRTDSTRSGHRMFSSGPRAPPFRIPEFRWSYLHQQLLKDLLFSIETDVQVWKSHTTKTVIDFVNSGENNIYVVNVTHMISQLADNLITSCGGLLPLLAAATSSNGEVEILEPTQGLSIEQAVSILLRIMNLTDILVFASSTTFAELEQEKNMPAGGILRQCLRLVCTAAVRNSLEVRHRAVPPTPPTPTSNAHPLSGYSKDTSAQNGTTDPIQALIEGSHPTRKNIVENLNEQLSPIKDFDKLLQDMDINRLRAVVYRDVEETKQAQFLALAIVYFTSVLMVSKYRDILEPPSPAQTPSQMPRRSSNHTPSGNQSEEDESEGQSETGESQEQDGDSSVDESQVKLKIPVDVHVNMDTSLESGGVTEDSEAASPARPVTEGGEDEGTKDSGDGEEQADDEPKGKDEDENDQAEKEDTNKTEETTEENEKEVGGAGDAEKTEQTEGAKDDEDKKDHDEDEEKKDSDETVQETDKDKSETATGEENDAKEEQKPEETAEETDKDKSETETTEVNDAKEEQKPEKTEEVKSEDSETASNNDKERAENNKPVDDTDKANEESKPTEDNAPAEVNGRHSPVDSIEGSAEGQEQVLSVQVAADGEQAQMPISSISAGTRKPSESHDNQKPEKLELKSTPIPGPVNLSMLDSGNLTERLEKALGSVAPLLREIFVDFAPYLSKTLIGSHGQELLIGGLVTLKQSTSVVELVMLLCSQEWQNSLQKHAGLAFIELVNEGRLLAHATRDHIVRVANEADFILNRMRAEDVQRHAEFESLCAQMMLDRREEEKLCDHLITSAKRRDYSVAMKMRDKVLNILANKHGAWGEPDKQIDEYWKLDVWEDDSRRRRRFIKNPIGSTHPDAALKAALEHGATEDAINQAREAFHAHLDSKKAQQALMPEYTDEELLMEDTEFEREYSGPVAMSTTCKLIAPGVAINGIMSITKTDLYYEMDEDDAENKKIDQEVLAYIDYLHGKWNFNEIRAIFSRRYLLQNAALEIFLANRTAIMFSFPDHATVKKVISALPRVGVGVKYGLGQSRRMSSASGKQLYKMSAMTQKWQRREISNFDYLMYLNTIAGRTYNDLNQYPVFPWVIVNYDSDELDLSQPNNFRDLSKPIGALNPSRKEFFEERYNSWEHDQIPPFHYGTHYSTSAFTLNWLIRVEPFTTMFLNLQGGKFDHADRTFHSVSQAWKNCQRDTSDVKELIPEFFALPEMFMNTNKFNLGKLDEGDVVHDVILPKWAKSPEDFVRINRMALESEFVSCQLHHWIDLIFGYKQRGPEAVRATNVFYYLTYEGSVNLESMTDIVMKEAIENQIRSFGQTPTQLLTEPHPPRSSVMHLSPMMFTSVQDDVCMIMKFLSNSPVCHVSANTHPAVPIPAVTTITCNHNFSINRWNQNYQLMNTGLQRRSLGDNFDQRLKVSMSHFVTTADNRFIFACGFWDKSFRLYFADTAKILQVVYGHFDVVTCITRSECNLNQDCYIVTGSKDCTVMVWMFTSRNQAIIGDNGSIDHPTPKATLTGHKSEVTSVSVLAELGMVISGSQDGPCLVHTLNGDLLRSLDPPDGKQLTANLICMSRETFVMIRFDQNIICNFSINGRLQKHIKHKDNIQAMTLSRDGQYVMMGGDSGVVEVYRSHDLTLLYSYPACDSCICSLALSHDHKFLLAGLATGCLLVFNIDFNKWHHEYQEKY